MRWLLLGMALLGVVAVSVIGITDVLSGRVIETRTERVLHTEPIYDHDGVLTGYWHLTDRRRRWEYTEKARPGELVLVEVTQGWTGSTRSRIVGRALDAPWSFGYTVLVAIPRRGTVHERVSGGPVLWHG